MLPVETPGHNNLERHSARSSADGAHGLSAGKTPVYARPQDTVIKAHCSPGAAYVRQAQPSKTASYWFIEFSDQREQREQDIFGEF